jgi:hypothetical protein
MRATSLINGRLNSGIYIECSPSGFIRWYCEGYWC